MAQETIEEKRRSAELANEKGLSLVDKHEFADAAQEFIHAYNIFPDAKYLFNAGRAFHLAKNPAEALLYYRRYLSESTDLTDKPQVEAWIADCETILRRTMGEITVAVSPPDATIYIDGNKQDGGNPLKILLDPGQHYLLVECKGYEPYRREFVVEPGRSQSIDVVLKEVSRTIIKIRSNITGARVFMDGRLVGMTPVEIPDVAEGQLHLQVEAEGFERFEVEQKISKGEVLTIEANLVKKPIPPQMMPRSQVIWRSLLFPGLGQLHAGHKTAGVVFITTEAITLAGVIGGLSTHQYYLQLRDKERDPDRWRSLNQSASVSKWIAISCAIGAGAVWVANVIQAVVMDLPLQRQSE